MTSVSPGTAASFVVAVKYSGKTISAIIQYGMSIET